MAGPSRPHDGAATTARDADAAALLAAHGEPPFRTIAVAAVVVLGLIGLVLASDLP